MLNKKPSGWNGNVRGIQKMFVTNRAVLRRPDVRTRTSTTPVGMGSGGNGDVGAWKNRFSQLNGVASGGGFGTYQRRRRGRFRLPKQEGCRYVGHRLVMGGWAQYVSGTWVLQKTDSSATKRGGIGGVGGDNSVFTSRKVVGTLDIN